MSKNAENITTDVLVLGGGLAGCFAAIKAAEKGAKVIIVAEGDDAESAVDND